mmetsp:Transcript_40921/g.108158  ORF Transcript_40921/g.108158 Transcript_40921/m.108158 type:complete len:372 (-) Transcript_40921:436-1551(-)
MVEDDALIDALRTDLEIALAHRHLDGRVEEDSLEVLVELFDLHRRKLRVHLVVLPHDRRALVLDHRAVGTRLVSLEDGGDGLLPAQVKPFIELLPLVAADAAHAREGAELEVEAVLRRQRRPLDPLEDLVDARALAAGEHHEQIAWVGSELLKAVVDARRQVVVIIRHEGLAQAVVEGDEGAAPVEEDGAAAGAPVRREHLRRIERAEGRPPAYAPEGREPEAYGRPRLVGLVHHALREVGGEALGPGGGGHRLDKVEVALVPRPPLGRAHRARPLHVVREVVRVPRVDSQRPVEHAGGRGELREKDDAGGAVAAGVHGLEGEGVDALADRREARHVRQPPQLHPLRQRDRGHLDKLDRARERGVDARDNL